MAEEPTTTTLVTPEKLPSPSLTPSEVSESTQDALPTETETLEKVTETNPPETADTTTKPEEETAAEHHPPTVTETETASTEKQEVKDEASQKEVAEEKKSMIPQNLGSFKEESSKLSDLSNSEKKSLDELKHLVREALDNHQFTNTPEEVKIWGIPLLEDDRSDVVLLKFLRAREFKVKDSFAMLKNTIKWRKESRSMNWSRKILWMILTRLCLCMDMTEKVTLFVTMSMVSFRTRSFIIRRFLMRKRGNIS